MKPVLLTILSLSSLSSGLLTSATALADPASGNSLPAVGLTTPAPVHAGSWELLLTAPPAVEDSLYSGQPRGFGLGETTQGGSGLFGYLGLSGGVAYSVTDLLAVGGAVSFLIDGVQPVDGTSGFYQLLAEPFVKFNLGPTLKTGTFNPYVLGGLDFGVQGTTGAAGQAWGLFGVDVDPGVEWLFGGRWGVQAFVPLQFQFATHSDAQVGFNIGVGYGLVGYL